MTVTRVDRPAEPPPVERPAVPKTEVVFSAQTVAKALGILFGLVLVVVAQEALLSIALAVVMIFGFDPPVSALERRGWGRGKAALTIFAAITLVLFVIIVWAVSPVWSEIKEFARNLPAYIEEASRQSPIKELHENTDVVDKVKSTLVDAAKSLPEAATSLLGAAGGALSSVFQLVTLTFLTLFGLVAKPLLTRSALELMPPATAERVDKTLDEVSRTVSFSLIGNVVISVIAGTIVGVAAVIVDAPSPIVLALIVGLFDLIPQVGSAIAAVIVVTVTLIGTGPTAAVILLAVILVYQQVENYLIQPAVMRQAVELTGFATIAVVMVGGALLGVVGAILAVPVAASVKVIMREATAGRRARMAIARAGES